MRRPRVRRVGDIGGAGVERGGPLGQMRLRRGPLGVSVVIKHSPALLTAGDVRLRCAWVGFWSLRKTLAVMWSDLSRSGDRKIVDRLKSNIGTGVL